MAKEITAKSDFWSIVLLIILAILAVWLFFFGGIYTIIGILSSKQPTKCKYKPQLNVVKLKGDWVV